MNVQEMRLPKKGINALATNSVLAIQLGVNVTPELNLLGVTRPRCVGTPRQPGFVLVPIMELSLLLRRHDPAAMTSA
jgi:hypothetical protein